MTSKSERPDQPETATPQSAMTELQNAGFHNLMGMSTAWVEAVSDMGAEVLGFVAERVKEDVKTQHKMLHCKNVAELQHIQAQFIQKAIDQYQEETGRLVEMSNSFFAQTDTSERKQ